jgi:hypothetical protein
MSRPPLEVADIVRQHGAAFLARYGPTLSGEQHRALQAIAVCRTAVLGGHVTQCDQCGHEVQAYNSCRHRCCPKCHGAAQAAWQSRDAALVISIHARSRLMKIIRPMTPLRQRMLEDMQIRNDSPHTIDAYLRSVAQFAKHFHTSPDRLGPDHIRTYQQFLIEEQQASWGTFIQAVCALRFFYETTLHRPWMVEYLPYPKKPKTLPVILSRDEVQALLLAPRHLKHRAILATLYATGVRVSELCHLQGTDIDSQRMVIRIGPPLATSRF